MGAVGGAVGGATGIGGVLGTGGGNELGENPAGTGVKVVTGSAVDSTTWTGAGADRRSDTTGTGFEPAGDGGPHVPPAAQGVPATA